MAKAGVMTTLCYRRAMASESTASKIEAELRAFALGYPQATEDFPWGDRVVKVKGKAFVFMGSGGDSVGISVKLPQSAEDVLALSFASPTRYGLGQHGWVTARFAPDAEVPIELLKTWIDESYRAVAPKRLLAQLPADRPRVR